MLPKFQGPAVMGLLGFLFLSPAPASSQEFPEVQTYDQLVRAIHDIRQATPSGNQSEKVRQIWTIGKLLELHGLEYRLWGDYDAYLLKRLSQDLNMSLDELRRMRRFARTYPDRVPPQDLDWWHYAALMDIRNPLEREALAARDEKEKWTSDQLQAELKKLREKNQKPPVFTAPPSLLEKLNYYRATVTHVLDGDTFYAAADLGFGLTSLQVFRLRGIDAPEMGTEEGIAAKRFLVLQLKQTKGDVILKLFSRDKYGRYVVDVWVFDTGHPNDGIHLNQKLIDEGLAVQVSE